MNNVVESAISIEKRPNPVPAEERARLLENPAFGRVFTDHMATIRYTEGKGWHDAKSARMARSSAIRPRWCCTTRRKSSRA